MSLCTSLIETVISDLSDPLLCNVTNPVTCQNVMLAENTTVMCDEVSGVSSPVQCGSGNVTCTGGNVTCIGGNVDCGSVTIANITLQNGTEVTPYDFFNVTQLNVTCLDGSTTCSGGEVTCSGGNVTCGPVTVENITLENGTAVSAYDFFNVTQLNVTCLDGDVNCGSVDCGNVTCASVTSNVTCNPVTLDGPVTIDGPVNCTMVGTACVDLCLVLRLDRCKDGRDQPQLYPNNCVEQWCLNNANDTILLSQGLLTHDPNDVQLDELGHFVGMCGDACETIRTSGAAAQSTESQCSLTFEYSPPPCVLLGVAPSP